MNFPSSLWGEICLDVGEAVLGRLGDRALHLRRAQGEWFIACGGFKNPDGVSSSSPSGWSPLDPEQHPLGEESVARTVFRESPQCVAVSPRLPDRSLVVRPVTELGIPPGERVAIFVSVPLWVDVSAGSPRASIYEQPLDRPPDTWFGDSTRSGELCYAGRTTARLNLENVAIPPARALTKISVDNRSGSLLSFTKLRLPLPQLSLYSDQQGLLWTEPALLVSEAASMAQLEIDADPEWLADKEKIRDPRIERSDGLLTRTFGLFFGRAESSHDD